MYQKRFTRFHYPFRVHIPILSGSSIVMEHMEVLDERFAICSHQHMDYEILYCLHGSVDLQTGEEVRTVHAGEYVIIPPDIWHQILYNGQQPKLFFSVSFSMDFRKEQERKNVIPQEYKFFLEMYQILQSGTALFGEDRHDAGSILQTMIAEFDRKEAGWISLMRNDCFEFLVRVFRNLIESSREADALQTESNLATDLMRYISVHFQENISLEDIANAVHVSPRHACRVFENSFGINMRRALHSCRISVAKDLLCNTDNSMDAIAANLGYADPEGFARWFKRLEGITVSQYRNRHRTSEKKQS